MNTIEIIKNVITEQLQITGLADIEIATIESLQPISIKLANDKVLEDNNLIILSEKLSHLKNTSDKNELGQQLITFRETGTGKYIFVAESE